MEKQKYDCNYAYSRANVRDEDGGVKCRLTDYNCPIVRYLVPFGQEMELENMKYCPTYNLSSDDIAIERINIIRQLRSIKRSINSELERKVEKDGE